MFDRSPTSHQPISGINVTPLVDITLVLLIILMVTAKIVDAPAVPLELPPAARSEQVQVVFSVLLPLKGDALVDGVEVASDDEMLAKAKASLAKHPELRAVISADGGVPHRRVIRVLDILKTAGIAKIAFGTVPEEGEKP